MAAAIFMAMTPDWKAIKPAKALFLIVLILFVGLRFEVGCDWTSYEGYHISYLGMQARDLPITREPLSHLFFWWSVNFGAGSAQTYLINATVLVGGCFAISRRTPYPWFAFLTIVPYFLLVFGMSGVRQAVAIGIVFFALSRWDRASFLETGLFLSTAVLFHFSAIFPLAFMLLKFRSLRTRIASGVLGMLIVFILITQVGFLSNSLDIYGQLYLGDTAVEADGSLLHLVLVLLPAVLGLIFFKRIKKDVFAPELLLLGIFAAFALIGVNAISSVGASRLSLYLHFIPMLVFPALLANLDRVTGLVFKAGVCAGYFLMFYIWLAYANTAICVFPYSNRLFL
ncbi:MAG: EpsG family protein [Litorimonas sp.]